MVPHFTKQKERLLNNQIWTQSVFPKIFLIANTTRWHRWRSKGLVLEDRWTTFTGQWHQAFDSHGFIEKRILGKNFDEVSFKATGRLGNGGSQVLNHWFLRCIIFIFPKLCNVYELWYKVIRFLFSFQQWINTLEGMNMWPSKLSFLLTKRKEIWHYYTVKKTTKNIFFFVSTMNKQTRRNICLFEVVWWPFLCFELGWVRCTSRRTN